MHSIKFCNSEGFEVFRFENFEYYPNRSSDFYYFEIDCIVNYDIFYAKRKVSLETYDLKLIIDGLNGFKDNSLDSFRVIPLDMEITLIYELLKPRTIQTYFHLSDDMHTAELKIEYVFDLNKVSDIISQIEFVLKYFNAQ